jgi:hypothetical protein
MFATTLVLLVFRPIRTTRSSSSERKKKAQVKPSEYAALLCSLGIATLQRFRENRKRLYEKTMLKLFAEKKT